MDHDGDLTIFKMPSEIEAQVGFIHALIVPGPMVIFLLTLLAFILVAQSKVFRSAKAGQEKAYAFENLSGLVSGEWKSIFCCCFIFLFVKLKSYFIFRIN